MERPKQEQTITKGKHKITAYSNNTPDQRPEMRAK